MAYPISDDEDEEVFHAVKKSRLPPAPAPPIVQDVFDMPDFRREFIDWAREPTLEEVEDRVGTYCSPRDIKRRPERTNGRFLKCWTAVVKRFLSSLYKDDNTFHSIYSHYVNELGGSNPKALIQSGDATYNSKLYVNSIPVGIVSNSRLGGVNVPQIRNIEHPFVEGLRFYPWNNYSYLRFTVIINFWDNDIVPANIPLTQRLSLEFNFNSPEREEDYELNYIDGFTMENGRFTAESIDDTLVPLVNRLKLLAHFVFQVQLAGTY